MAMGKAAWQGKAEGLEREVSELRTKGHQFMAERNQAIKDAENVRAQFGELKRRLHESEMERARLQGMIDRVHETDKSVEPTVVVTERRTMPLMRADNRQRGGEAYGRSPLMSAMDAEANDTHWTNYK